MAFENGVTVSFFSTTTKSIPYRMSWQASESPVGPAPMMITSVVSVFMPISLRHFRRGVMSRKMYFAPPIHADKHRSEKCIFRDMQLHPPVLYLHAALRNHLTHKEERKHHEEICRPNNTTLRVVRGPRTTEPEPSRVAAVHVEVADANTKR